jgi:butyryl-CoA dehydrogenase
MDFELTDEQRLIKSTAREFTDAEIVERSRENARNHHFDLEIVSKLAHQGYLGAIVPQEYGGAGLDYVSYGLIVEEIGRGDSSVRTVISVQTSLVCSAILKWGTEKQKQRYLPRLCSGEWLGCFGLTEPDTGSDAANQRTRATKTDSGWVINGAKMWISMGNYARLAMIFAQTDPALGHKGLGCFLVDTDQAGFKTAPIEHKKGLHASDTASIALEDVEVAEDGLLGEVGDGLKWRCRRLTPGATRLPPGAWASARAASRSRSTTPRSANSSGARSRASS